MELVAYGQDVLSAKCTLPNVLARRYHALCSQLVNRLDEKACRASALCHSEEKKRRKDS